MKNMKKLFALVLALALCFSLAVPAMAADDHVHTLTINGTASGHVYNVYRVFKGAMVEKDGKMVLSDIQWGDSIVSTSPVYDYSKEVLDALKADAALSTTDGDVTTYDFAAAATAEDVANVLKTYADKGAKAQAFANVIGKILVDNEVDAYTTATEKDKATHVYEATVSDGYYLIMDGQAVDGKHDFQTKYLLSVPENDTLTVKGDVPTVNKTVSDATAAAEASFKKQAALMMGKPYFYKWEGSMHENIADYATYKYQFIDTLPAGVVLADENLNPITKAEDIYKAIVSVEVISGVNSNNHVAMPAKSETYPNGYEVSYSGNEFTLGWKDLIAAYKEAPGTSTEATLGTTSKVVVKYRTALTSTAGLTVEGLTNEVKLKFSNNPYGEGEGQTPNDPAVVFTYGLNMFKIDAQDGKKHLAGAKFDLYQVISDAEGKDVKEYAVLQEQARDNGRKVYSIIGWTTTLADGRVQIVTEADADGNSAGILIKGLDASLYEVKDGTNELITHAETYYLHETEAPAGYNTLKEDPYFHMTAYTQKVDGKIKVIDIDYSKNGVVVDENADGDENGIAETAIAISVANGAGTVLPSTGGAGTTMFYIVGGILVAAAVILLITKKRMGEEA